MNLLIHLLILVSLIAPLTSPSPSPPTALKLDSSLSVDNKDDFLISPDGVFTAGFYSVGENVFCFSVWFTKPLFNGNQTVVWMANRDAPVNGKRSKLSLSKTGNLVLQDADQELPIWTTRTRDLTGSAQLKLNNSGNLFLQTTKDEQILWQSFGSPTNTLLPNQPLTKDAVLVSSRSETNYSSGFYKLIFDNDNVLRLVYSGPKVTGVYWPDPELRAWDSGRSTYGSERTAMIDQFGRFISSDGWFFNTSDDGGQPMRRLTMDVDGNVRVYSLDEGKRIWKVTWQAIAQTCSIHGSCGENSTCSNEPSFGRKCSCLPFHKMVNRTDWSYGCEPEFRSSSCGSVELDGFLHLPHFDFYGYDLKYLPNTTLEVCKQECKTMCNCKGFQYKFDKKQGIFLCYPKFLLLNGFGSVSFNGSLYLRVPKSTLSSNTTKRADQQLELNCSGISTTVPLDRVYDKKKVQGSIRFMLLFTYVFGAFEFICIVYFFYTTQNPATKSEGNYLQVATGFERFTYRDLKKASENFKNEIGRGGGAVVYKGILSDNRVAAIKCLKQSDSNSNKGDAEFLAEVSTLGRLNHMNLINIWGYCAEGKHRILVYEYMENGSLAENLHSDKKLDWDKRFEVAVGTAKGLAYLHEECLEWVLHCDVKPQNILLDHDYSPKVADFGLLKFVDRDGRGGKSEYFTKARGTRGYMAPEWFFVSLPITSKVDVYSFGVVMLEMITGRSAQGGDDQRPMVRWVRDKVSGYGDDDVSNCWIEEIVDSTVKGEYDPIRMATLIKVALQCAEEYMDARPTMSQVVDMLLI